MVLVSVSYFNHMFRYLSSTQYLKNVKRYHLKLTNYQAVLNAP